MWAHPDRWTPPTRTNRHWSRTKAICTISIARSPRSTAGGTRHLCGPVSPVADGGYAEGMPGVRWLMMTFALPLAYIAALYVGDAASQGRVRIRQPHGDDGLRQGRSPRDACSPR